MKLAKNAKELWIGCWILAGLLIVGVNSAKLLSLYNRPVAASFRFINQVRLKMSQFEAMVLAWNAQKKGSDLKLAMKNYTLTDPTPIEPAHVSKMQEKDRNGQPPDLPELSGVMRVMDSGGAYRYLAVIEGRPCVEKDRIRGFLVEKISIRGITVARNGGHWDIPCPNAEYSSEVSD